MITKINMPFMYARRVLINTYYPKLDRARGSFVTVNSSVMNEVVLEEAKKERNDATKPVINDEVVAFNHINYVKIEPLPNGCTWTSVYCLDVGGMVAKKFQKKLKDAQLQQAHEMIEFVKQTCTKLRLLDV